MATAGDSVLLRSELDPTTRTALDSFRRRRTVLLSLRSIGVGLLVFISLAMLLATVDYLMIIPDAARWAASITIYLVTAVAMWLSGLSELRRRNPVELARHLESVAPNLREDLVSAVELAAPESSNGSASFRRILQSRVAKRIAAVDIAAALPLALVRRWLLSGGAVAAVCVALLFIPAAQFGRRLARAALPGVPIERASRTQVTILQPAPPDGYVAERDAVGVVVLVDGAEPDDVMLHWRASDGTSGETVMTPRMNAGDFLPAARAADGDATDGDAATVSQAETNGEAETAAPGVRFAANLSVGSLPMQYRITAGDAVTLWHELTPLPRPRVVRYEKRYRFPDYAKLQDRVASEEHGDLKALQGTTAEVTVTFDQPVENPVVRFGVRGTRNNMQPVDESDTRFLARISIKTSGQYQVDATSVRSGLNNPFTPTNTITPVLDTPPTVRFDDQLPRSRVVSSLDVVDLSAVAFDDLPLDRITQEVQVNDGPIETYQLAIESPAKQLRLDWQWDLLHRLGENVETDKLAVGDRVQTRLVAVDRRGARSESEALEFLIADDGFDASRHEFLQGFSQQTRRIVDWAAAARQVADAAEQAGKTQEFGELPDVNDRWRELQQESVALMKSLSGSLSVTQNTAAASITQLVGEAILDIDTRLDTQLKQLQWLSEHDDDAWQNNRNKAAQAVARAAGQTVHQCERLQEFARARFASAFTAAMYADVRAMKRRVGEIVDSLPIERLPRYLTLLRGQFAEVDRLVKSHETLLPEQTINHLSGTNWSRFSQDWSLQLETVLEENGRRDQVLGILQSLREQIAEKPQHVVDSGIRNTMLRFGRDLRNENGYLADLVGELNEAGRQWEQDREQAQDQRDADGAALRGLDARLSELRWRTALNRLLVRAAGQEQLNRAAAEVDLQYAADQALFVRAIKNVTENGYTAYRDQPPREVFDAIGGAIAMLQGAAEVATARDDLLAIAAGEQQPDGAPLRKFYHPIWFQLQSPRIELGVRSMRDAAASDDPNVQTHLQAIDAVRYDDDQRDAHSRLDSRVWRLDPFLSAARPLESMAERLRGGLVALQPQREQAREVLRRYVLTLSEQARQAAEKTRQAEQQTDDRSDATESTRSELREPQDRAIEKATETIGALIDRANTSGILDQQERELARDADAAAELISEAVRQTKEALKQSEQAASENARDASLESAEQKLGELAERLEQTAEHFEKLENGEDVSESREQLRRDEETLQNAAALDERYRQAEEMAQTASQDPRELLRQLEEELRRNEPMQQALSEIAADLVDEVTESLQQSARDEAELQRRLETEDTAFREKIRQQQHLVEELVARAKTLSDQTLRTASRAAGWANQPETRDQIDALREQLDEAAERAARAAEGNPTSHELKAAAEQLQQQLRQAAETTERVNETLNENAEQDIHRDDRKRKDSASAMSRTRNQLRNDELKAIDRQRRQWSSVEKNAGSRVQSAEKKQRAAENQLNQDQQRLEDDPENENLKQQLDRSRDRFEQAKATAENARQTRELARERREQANQRANQINDKRAEPLDKPNPAAELGAEIAEDVGQRLRQLAQELQPMTAADNPAGELNATSDSARSIAEQQERVERDVQAATDDLARAARHEARLERPENAQQLAQAAEQTMENAGRAAEQAGQQLQRAAEEAGESAAASEALRQASQTIDKQANQLQNQFAQQPPTSPQQAGTPSPRGEAGSPPQTPQSQAAPQPGEPPASRPGGQPPAQPSPSADPTQPPNPATTPPPSSTPGRSASPAEPSAGDAAEDPAGDAPSSQGGMGTPQQMAQTLDDLDETLSALAASGQRSPTDASQQDGQNAAEQGGQNASPGPDGQGQRQPSPSADDPAATESANSQGQTRGGPQNAMQASPTLAQMLEQQRQQAARERMQSLQQAQQAGQQNSEGSDADGASEPIAQSGQGDVPDAPENVELLDGELADGDWGDLRQRGVEDAAQGRGARVPPGYAREIQAYFKALSRRAAESKP